MDSCTTELADNAEAIDRWAQQTSLFQHWARMKQEILLHKWYESERAGHDIGWERASVDWMIRFGKRSTRS